MADLSKGAGAPILNARELFCGTCGRAFVFRGCEQEVFTQRGWAEPKCCPACRKAERELRRKKTERRERQKRQQEKVAEQELFEARLKDWNIIAEDDICPENDHVLYIIGNGFDLMHEVRSSYYAFRDSLGKENPLRYALENFLTTEDIWADFEDALACFDIRAMCSGFLVDSYLDIFEAYDFEYFQWFVPCLKDKDIANKLASILCQNPTAFMELDYTKSENDYVHLPCDAVDSPDSIIYPAVKNLVDDSLEYRMKQQSDDGNWPLGWSFGDDEGFRKLQILYEASRTMRMLAKLGRFGRIEL